VTSDGDSRTFDGWPGVQENLKATIKHVVEVHGELLREIDYVTTFKEFCLRYEQNEDSSMLEPLPYVTSTRVPYVHGCWKERGLASDDLLQQA
jgi:hypothetical protein